MNDEKKIYTGTILDESVRFTLIELCVIGKADAEWVIELVDEGMLEPEGHNSEEWKFDAKALKRIQSVQRLQRDLRINLPGAALVLDLLDEVEYLKNKLHQQ